MSASKRLDVMKQWNLEMDLPFVHAAKRWEHLNICENELSELNGTETKAVTKEEKKNTRTKRKVLI